MREETPKFESAAAGTAHAKRSAMGRFRRFWAPFLACHLAACSFPTINLPSGDDDGDDSESTPPPTPGCDDSSCASFGGECRAAVGGGRICLLIDTPCDPLAVSVCSGDEVHECQQGFAEQYAETECQRFEQCYQATSTNLSSKSFSFAHCGMDAAPCADNVRGECRGNVAVQCEFGFPYTDQPCDDDQKRCEESEQGPGTQSAACFDDVTCPADVSPQTQPIGVPLPFACDGDEMIDCGSPGFPVVFAHCDTLGEHCSSGGITTCTVSTSGPAAPEWRSIPAGHYTPSIGLIAGVPTDVAAFDMLRTEVTLGQYDACVQAGACSGSFGCEPGIYRGDLPLGCPTESGAAQYCASLGARLPTAAEWEYAARNAGADGPFPWGDDAATCADIGFEGDSGESSSVNVCDGQPAVGCSHERDVTAQGICDLAGNLSEWVARVDPDGASERGLNYEGVATTAKIDGVDDAYTSGGDETIGFRCVK